MKQKKFLLRISDDEFKYLNTASRNENKSMSEYLRELMRKEREEDTSLLRDLLNNDIAKVLEKLIVEYGDKIGNIERTIGELTANFIDYKKYYKFHHLIMKNMCANILAYLNPEAKKCWGFDKAINAFEEMEKRKWKNFK